MVLIDGSERQREWNDIVDYASDPAAEGLQLDHYSCVRCGGEYELEKPQCDTSVALDHCAVKGA